MTTWLKYLLITALLLAAELVYFRIADKCNIIDKPNQRSSHSSIVLRGGGIIFVLGLWIWAAFFGFHNIWFLIAVTLVAGVSFIDDIHSLPDSVRLVAQFAAMALMFYQLDMLHWNMWWIILIAMIVCVGASNIINFMDGVNGITGAYAMASLLPLFLLNKELSFADESLIAVVALAAAHLPYRPPYSRANGEKTFRHDKKPHKKQIYIDHRHVSGCKIAVEHKHQRICYHR